MPVKRLEKAMVNKAIVKTSFHYPDWVRCKRKTRVREHGAQQKRRISLITDGWTRMKEMMMRRMVILKLIEKDKFS